MSHMRYPWICVNKASPKSAIQHKTDILKQSPPSELGFFFFLFEYPRKKRHTGLHISVILNKLYLQKCR